MKTFLRGLFVTVLLASVAIAQSPWTLQTSGSTQRIRVIRPVNTQVVWVCGHAGTVLRTVDGGTTWQLKTLTDASFHNYGIEALDSTTAWVIGTASSVSTTGDTRIWKTTNGGTTWTQQAQLPDSWGDGIRFFDANNGIAVGDPSQATKSKMAILTTTNGGTTWTQIPSAGNPAVDSVADEVGIYNSLELTGSIAWLMTYGNSSAIQPRVFKSTDKGLTWTASPKIAIDNSYGFSMKDATTGIMSNINSGSISKTSNGWATADSMLVFGGVYGLRCIDWIPGTNSIVIVGGPSSTGFSGVSKDGGKTWTPQTMPAGIARLWAVAFANSSTGWAGDNVGKIIKWTGGDLASVTTQVHLSDDFTAANGTALTSAGWTLSGTTTTNPLTVTTPGLSFAGHPGSGVGGAVPMTNTGQDVYRTFAPVNSGSVYLSFLMNVSAAQTGDYFIAVSPSASQTNYYARLHVKSSGSGYNIGISKSNEVSGGAQYGTTVYNLNTTYFAALKYTFTGTAADSTNDPISVYVVPSGSSLATEPATPEVNAYVFTGRTDATDLGYVTLRQGSNTSAPTMVIDAIRVGNSWASALAAATSIKSGATVPLMASLSQNYPNPFNPSTTINFDLPAEEIVTVKVYNSLGQEMLTLLSGKLGAGNHTVRFDASKLTSGVYFYQITAGKFTDTKKMMLVK